MNIIFFKIALIAALLGSASASAVDVIDGKNPRYITSVEHLARAVQLMNSLETEFSKIYNLDSLPGYKPELEMGRILEMKARANFILNPERRRLSITPLDIKGGHKIKSTDSLTKEKVN
jgi:hypothetical protein